MPSLTAQTAGNTLRRALAEIAGGYRSYTTTGAGNAGGTTFVVSGLDGIGSDYVLDMPWVLQTDGANIREFRRATGLSGSTVTVSTAYTAQVASGVTMDMYPFRPSLYKQALSKAFQKLYPSIYRLVEAYRISNNDRMGHLSAVLDNWYSTPQNMVKVGKVWRCGIENLWDDFDRADNASDAGNGWTAAAGTFGIISNRLYSLVDDSLLVRSSNPLLQNLYIECEQTGTLNSGNDYSVLSLIFRYIDSSNFLMADMNNSGINITKFDGGTATSLNQTTFTPTNGTYYKVAISAIGTRLRVWVDDVLYLDYQLTGANATKYVIPGNIGFKSDLGGAPGTPNRANNYVCYQLTPEYEWLDWHHARGLPDFELPYSSSARPSGLLRIQGTALLSALTADNVTSLASDDATAVVEIATTDTAYQTLLAQARAELFYLLGAEIYPTGIPENSRQYTEMGITQEALVQKMVRMPALRTRMRGAVGW